MKKTSTFELLTFSLAAPTFAICSFWTADVPARAALDIAGRAEEFFQSYEEAFQDHLQAPLSDRAFKQRYAEEHRKLESGKLPLEWRKQLITKFLKLMGTSLSGANYDAAAAALDTLGNASASSADAAAALELLQNLTGAESAEAVANALGTASNEVFGAGSGMAGNFQNNTGNALSSLYAQGGGGNSLNIPSIANPAKVRYQNEGKIGGFKAGYQPKPPQLNMGPLASNLTRRRSSPATIGSRGVTGTHTGNSHSIGNAIGSSLAGLGGGRRRRSVDTGTEDRRILGNGGHTNSRKPSSNLGVSNIFGNETDSSTAQQTPDYSGILGGAAREQKNQEFIQRIESIGSHSAGSAGSTLEVKRKAQDLKEELESCQELLEKEANVPSQADNNSKASQQNTMNAFAKYVKERQTKVSKDLITRDNMDPRFCGGESGSELDRGAVNLDLDLTNLDNSLAARVGYRIKNCSNDDTPLTSQVSEEIEKELNVRGGYFQTIFNTVYPECEILESQVGGNITLKECHQAAAAAPHDLSIDCPDPNGCDMFSGSDRPTSMDIFKTAALVQYLRELTTLQKEVASLRSGNIPFVTPEESSAVDNYVYYRLVQGLLSREGESLDTIGEARGQAIGKLANDKSQGLMGSISAAEIIALGRFDSGVNLDGDPVGELNIGETLLGCFDDNTSAPSKIRDLEWELRNIIFDKCGKHPKTLAHFKAMTAKKHVFPFESENVSDDDLIRQFKNPSSATLHIFKNALPITRGSCQSVSNKIQDAAVHSLPDPTSRISNFGFVGESTQPNLEECSNLIQLHNTFLGIAGVAYEKCASENFSTTEDLQNTTTTKQHLQGEKNEEPAYTF